MDNRKEVIFSDLGGLCQPQANISPVHARGKWNAVSYETAEIKGTLLAALSNSFPEDVRLSPQLTGWYRVYVGIPACWSSGNRSVLNLKMTKDQISTQFSHQAQPYFARQQVQEAFWRCADMTGQDIVIHKYPEGKALDAVVAWLRFVPMDEAEVAAFQKDQARTDTKRIYATNDMHGMICAHGFRDKEEWHSVIDDYDQSDAEWFSFENVRIFDGDVPTESWEDFAFAREVDQRVQRLFNESYTLPMLKEVVDYGHSKGLKICSSLRMGAWGMEFPFDQCYFDNQFFLSHQHLRCIDRDGDPISAMSYLYPEVQDYIIGHLLDMAKLGVDAVELIATRGIPYLLFEKPFTDAFTEKYGEDPRTLPLDEPRVMELRCELLTGFFRKVRKALDDTCGKDKVRLHLRCLFSLYDNRYIGLDVERLVREGIIQGIISYPQRLRELIAEDMWQADGKHIDLNKYHQAVINGNEPLIRRETDFDFLPPTLDTRGVPQGPESQTQRIKEFMDLEREYGVTVFFDLLPRIMMPEELKRRVLDLYHCGAERLSFWDTYSRAPARLCWSMLRRIGHKEELENWDSGEGQWYKIYRILRYDHMDVTRYMPAWGG